MQSALYAGKVRHRRFAPIRHEFDYRLFLMYIDLAELDDVFRGRWFWRNEQVAPMEFRRSDHLGDAALPLDACVRDLVETRGKARPQGPIRLLTGLRSFGYVMNPVSFYFCFDRRDRQVEFVVAEVTNTPWGERHNYVLDMRDDDAEAERRATVKDGGAALTELADARRNRRLRSYHAKEFHVSPFMEMNLEYGWIITPPGARLDLQIGAFRSEELVFDATLQLRRCEITGRNLSRTLMSFPLMAGRIAAAIYWQAFRLWRKGAPFVPHPRTVKPSKASVT